MEVRLYIMEEVAYPKTTDIRTAIKDCLDAAKIQNYWRVNASPKDKTWDMQNLPVGKEIVYKTKKSRKQPHFDEASKGDLVLGYITGKMITVSLFVVSKPDNNSQISFQKILNVQSPFLSLNDININTKTTNAYSPYNTTFIPIQQDFFLEIIFMMISKDVLTLSDFQNAIKSIPSLISGSGSTIVPSTPSSAQFSTPTTQYNDKYDKEEFCNDVYGFDLTKFKELKMLLETKKNIILQGAPGVGKTYAAKRLAYAMMGKKDDSRIEFVQFHQNYAYENFVMGYKPNNNGGFDLTEGIFYKFCKEAENSDEPYFFIIDEINRGNLSKIFGELLMLIENNHRKEKVKLAYKDEPFSVPENLYIIGMMNTADRSLAMIDYALRRRFSFYDMKPAFDSETFKKYQEQLNSQKLNKLIDAVIKLNNEVIAKDDSLGEGFCIGHSYFCNLKVSDDDIIRNIISYDIIPMLKEYWFDDTQKFDNESKKLLEALN